MTKMCDTYSGAPPGTGECYVHIGIDFSSENIGAVCFFTRKKKEFFILEKVDRVIETKISRTNFRFLHCFKT